MAGYNQYIGMRYVPLIDGAWVNTKTYEPLVVVTYNGNSYISKTFVPAGELPTNEQYWILAANYNAQVEQYRQEVREYQQTVDDLAEQVTNSLDEFQGDLNTLSGDLTSYKQMIGTRYYDERTTNITTAGLNTPAFGARLDLAPGTYVITGTWAFPATGGSGAKSIQASIGTNSNNYCTQRIAVSGDNWQSLNVSFIVVLSAQTTVYLKGSSDRTYTWQESGANNNIEAVRLK